MAEVTASELARLRVLAALGTQGKLRIETGVLECCDGPERIIISAQELDAEDGGGGYCVASFGTDDQSRRDAELFLAAVEALPALLAEIEKWRSHA